MLEALPVVRLNLGALRDREFADRPTGSRRARICCHARLTGCGSFENRTLVVSTLVQRLRARVEQGNLNSLAAGDRFTELGAQLAAPPSTGHQSAWRPRKSKARPSLRSVLGAPKRRPAGLRTPRRVRLLRHRTAGRLRSAARPSEPKPSPIWSASATMRPVSSATPWAGPSPPAASPCAARGSRRSSRWDRPEAAKPSGCWCRS